ncbi:MAG: hypothetical protein ACK52L_13205, partial [Pirellula sp.]
SKVKKMWVKMMVYTPGYCMPRLPRFEPCTPPAFRTMSVFGYSPTAIQIMRTSGVPNNFCYAISQTQKAF